MELTKQQPPIAHLSDKRIEDLGVVCKVCHTESKFSDIAVTRKVDGNVREMGLLCPKCKTFFHSNFISLQLEATLKRISDRVKLHRASATVNGYHAIKSMQASYKKEFDELNKRLRARYKLEIGEPSVKAWE